MVKALGTLKALEVHQKNQHGGESKQVVREKGTAGGKWKQLGKAGQKESYFPGMEMGSPEGKAG